MMSMIDSGGLLMQELDQWKEVHDEIWDFPLAAVARYAPVPGDI
jgi:hypothetical protein